jgi:hypothetical protein
MTVPVITDTLSCFVILVALLAHLHCFNLNLHTALTFTSFIIYIRLFGFYLVSESVQLKASHNLKKKPLFTSTIRPWASPETATYLYTHRLNSPSAAAAHRNRMGEVVNAIVAFAVIVFIVRWATSGEFVYHGICCSFRRARAEQHFLSQWLLEAIFGIVVQALTQSNHSSGPHCDCSHVLVPFFR